MQAEEVVVTARRRAENIQKVPVTVTALGQKALQTLNVNTTQDLMKVVPGIVFTSAGLTENATFSIRGQGTFVVGPGIPSVISYLNEVPLPAYGSVLPTYDVSSTQVLKGPQGTLFGRNTTGGAVLLYTTPPNYKFGGYVEGLYGSYNWQDYQGAINIPIIDGKLAVRIAAQETQRDGYTKNIGIGGDEDDLNAQKYRISVLAEPIEGLKNVLVYDRYWNSSVGPGVVGFGYIPNGEYSFIPQAFACGVSPLCDVPLAVKQQLARGPRVVDSNVAEEDNALIQAITNTTTYQLPYDITLKNIFGYHSTSQHAINNTDGLALSLLDDLGTNHHDRQVSDEAQISGTLLNDNLQFLMGGFFVDDSPTGTNSLALDVLRPPTIPVSAWPFGSVSNGFYTDQSRAVFFNLNYKIGNAIPFLKGLSVDAGFRYTWDSEGVCAISQLYASSTPIPDLSACRRLESPSTTIPGSFNDKVDFSAPTYTVSLDYQLNKDIFLYFTNRRGYRAGNLNQPRLGGDFTEFQTFLPQTVEDYEVGIKTNWQFQGIAGRFNIDGFTDKYNNLQRNITGIPPNKDGDNNPLDDPSNTSLTINGAVATIQGFEYDGVISPVPGFSITYSGSYLSPRYDSLTEPAALAGIAGNNGVFENTPRWSYTFGGRYQLPVSPLDGDLFMNVNYYHTDSYVVGVVTVPGHKNIDLSIDWEGIAGKAITATFFIQNLTNETYPVFDDLSGTSPGVLSFGFNAPRMFGFKLRYGFGGTH